MLTGVCGTTTSNTAALTVNTSPSITTQPAAQAVCPGNTATFTVGASGPGLSYQWYGSGGAISGATSASYTNGAADSYYCAVTDACGATTSNSAALTLGVAPSITAQPSDVTVAAGQPASFTVAAVGHRPHLSVAE